MAAQKQNASYNNQSIKSLKGADRVRKRPGVIFGSDGLDGCEHSFFEILSNSVDEAKEGYGKEIEITAYADHSLSVIDHGRGVPLGYNEAEQRYNWELIYCELYAGGKYDNNADDSSYEFSLGLNGLGACATQYSSEFMDVYSYDGINEYKISFKKGEPVTELITRPLGKNERRTGTHIHWKPDIEVFTDINIPHEFFRETLKRQAIVNEKVCFSLRLERLAEELVGNVYVGEYLNVGLPVNVRSRAPLVLAEGAGDEICNGLTLLEADLVFVYAVV